MIFCCGTLNEKINHLNALLIDLKAFITIFNQLRCSKIINRDYLFGNYQLVVARPVIEELKGNDFPRGQRELELIEKKFTRQSLPSPSILKNVSILCPL